MLNLLLQNFTLISRAGTFAAKILAVGMTSFGLRKLWSQDAAQKYTLNARLTFSGIYLLHMITTFIAATLLIGASPVSAPLASIMLGSTSFLINYADLIEAHISHSILARQYHRMEKKLASQNLELEKSHTLIEGLKECQEKIELLGDELQILRTNKDRIISALALPSLDKKNEIQIIFAALNEQYQHQDYKNKIVQEYFEQIDKDYFDVNTALEKNQQTIINYQQQIAQLQAKLTAAKAPKVINHALKSIETYKNEIQKLGIINVQCIAYRKIEHTINLLEQQLQYLNPTEDNELLRQYYDNRIMALNKWLNRICNPEADQFLNLDFCITTPVSEQIEADVDSFSAWLLENLSAYILHIEERLTDQIQTAHKLKEWFTIFPWDPQSVIKDKYTRIQSITGSLLELKKDLRLEALKIQNNKTKVNFGTAIFPLTLLSAFLPKNHLFFHYVKQALLGIGIINNITGVWSFYRKNLVTKKELAKKQQQMKCIKKEIAFKKNHQSVGSTQEMLTNVFSQIKSLKLAEQDPNTQDTMRAIDNIEEKPPTKERPTDEKERKPILTEKQNSETADKERLEERKSKLTPSQEEKPVMQEPLKVRTSPVRKAKLNAAKEITHLFNANKRAKINGRKPTRQKMVNTRTRTNKTIRTRAR